MTTDIAPTEFKSEVDPKALQVLFNADPESLTDRDIEHICVELRKLRANFETQEEVKSMAEKKPRVKTTPITDEKISQLSLDDLGL